MAVKATAALFLGGGQRTRIREIENFARALADSNIRIRTDDAALAQALNLSAAATEDLLDDCLFAVGFGGDGTILHLARKAAACKVPVLGINFGQLGFLAESGAEELDRVAQRLGSGSYETEDRNMLRADFSGKSIYALNDIVIRRESPIDVLRARVFVEGERLDDYVADGLLISTTTGATAYALSCGGPIVDPSLEVTSFTPICPHSLRARTILMNPQQVVQASVFSRSLPAMVCADGQDILTVESEEPIRIGPAPYKARFIRLRSNTAEFYTKVWSKLVDRTQ